MASHSTQQIKTDEKHIINTLLQKSNPIENIGDLDILMKRIGEARIVMLGEASHGTHEYYSWRTHITERLIKEKGFNFIAVEGDWPDCYRLNRYIKNYLRKHESAFHVLKSFDRWPTWMWGNWETLALAEWLKENNRDLPANKKVGFYGLDVYSLWESMEAILQYLNGVDPAAMKMAEEAFRCFEPFRKEEGQSYARASQFVPDLCETEVVELLKTIRSRLPSYNTDHENVFSTEQNALIAVNAEKYYRAMIKGGPHSWNLRDRHMADTLERLLNFHGPEAKAIVWAHNTHIGDARATDMTADGMYNIGELIRMKHNEDGVVLVGFGSYKGKVIAGKSWGSPMKEMDVPPAQRGSWEYLLHEAGTQNRLLIMDDFMDDTFMETHIAHRAIGVVYNPAIEQYGNYVPSILPLRYDAFIYLDETKALHPLNLEPHGHQMPETYPFGL